MENNNQNAEIIIDEAPHPTQKKALLFISLSLVIPALIGQLCNMILSEIFPEISVQDAESFAGLFTATAAYIIEFILIIITGFKLTTNRTDTIRFIGISQLGKMLGSLTVSPVSIILGIFLPSATEYSSVQGVISTASTVASIIFIYTLYNRLIANNTLHSVSFAESSAIRKNMIFAYISVFLSGILLSGAIAIIPVLESTGIVREGFSDSNFVTILSDVISMLTTFATLTILYFFGFRHSKNRNDALNFTSCYYLSVIPSAVLSVASVFLNALAVKLMAVEYAVVFPITFLLFLLSVSAFILEIIIVFRTLRRVFPVQQITPEPFPAEETYTDDFYIEPSHIENAPIQEPDIDKFADDELTEQ